MDIKLIVDRKSNTTRPLALKDYVNLKAIRKTIEISFPVISGLVPKKIHTRKQVGFELKILGFN